MNIFRRIEQKYLITKEQHDALLKTLGDNLVKDEYFYNDIYNLYLDTPNRELIIQSMEIITRYGNSSGPGGGRH